MNESTLRTGFVCIATEGKAVDGRDITREWLVDMAETYDPTLRQIAIDVIREHGIPVHERGTVVVIQGPRFSTKAESKCALWK